MKALVITLSCCLAALAAAFAVARVVEAPATGAPVPPQAPADAPADAGRATVTLAFAGDVMLSRAIGKLMAEEGFEYPYAKLGGLLADADIAFANLETSVSERGENVGSIYSFRSDPDALPALKAAGVDVVSVANNHIWDWGRVAFLDTLGHLKSNGIEHAGGGADYAAAHAPAMVEANGVSVAYLAYTNLLPQFLLRPTSSPAVAFPTEAALREDIARAKAAGADIVVASFHWGEEYKPEHNAYQERLGRAAIDAGALIVAGHHPHTPQEIERYKNGLIIYSLGNLVFDQNFDEFTRNGLVVRATVEGGRIRAVEEIEVRFTPGYQPYAFSTSSSISIQQPGI